jgi:L-seryl-tRNA(Ser) seleniumtransferase
MSQVERHPLARAVRADKSVLAGLAATLRHYLVGEAESVIPIWRMIAAPEALIRQRALRLRDDFRENDIPVEVMEVRSTIGGGSLPGESLPSWAVTLASTIRAQVDDLARRLRLGSPGVFGRVEGDKVVLDLRTVLPEDDAALARVVRSAASQGS